MIEIIMLHAMEEAVVLQVLIIQTGQAVVHHVVMEHKREQQQPIGVMVQILVLQNLNHVMQEIVIHQNQNQSQNLILHHQHQVIQHHLNVLV